MELHLEVFCTQFTKRVTKYKMKDDKVLKKYDYLHLVIFIFWCLVFYFYLGSNNTFDIVRILILSFLCWFPSAAFIFGRLIKSNQLTTFGIFTFFIYIVYFFNYFEK